MSPSYKSAIILLALSSAGEAFSPQVSKAATKSSSSVRLHAAAPSSVEQKEFFFANVVDDSTTDAPVVAAKAVEAGLETSTSSPTPTPKKAPKRTGKKKAGPVHKEGIFSPAVMAAKMVMGDKNLNKVRGEAISLHSQVIKGVIGTGNDSAIGRAALAQLFSIADKDGNGEIDKEELAAAMKMLGFDWLKEKQIDGIFKRADTDGNGTIDFEEFVNEAPKTLQTNIVKLAKKNGGELGFLV